MEWNFLVDSTAITTQKRQKGKPSYYLLKDQSTISLSKIDLYVNNKTSSWPSTIFKS